jgi:phosphoglycerol transferase MdoB-like AlkP superfamily enzyme
MRLQKYFSQVILGGNCYVVLVQRLMITMVLFTITRLFFYIYNQPYFPDLDLSSFLRILWGGLQFDLTAVLYLNLPFILMMVIPLDIRFNRLYGQIALGIYYITNGLGLAANVADTVYYRFTLRRTTADIFRQFENETNLGSLFLRFLVDYWYAVVFWLLLVYLMVWWNKRYRISGPQIKNRIVYYTLGVFSIPVVAYLFIGGVRGGFRHSTRPIAISNAAAYVRQAAEVNIVLNTPFSVFRTIGKNKIVRVKWFDEEELENIYTPVHYPADTAAMRNMNVVILILESFSREFVGALNTDKPGYSGYTPFLDSLIQHSLTFRYSFANGRKSIDALPAILAGIPSLEIPFVLTPFANNRLRSLPLILHNEGYHTSFFHGAPNGSMGFDAFVNLAGIRHYYGMNEYGNDEDFDGMWGIWDHKFLSFFAEKLNTFAEPFFSVFFSVTSHHPFTIPDEFDGYFKGGDQPILKCIEYTDYALGAFFRSAQKQPWYANTLFVITADHCSSNVLFPETRTAWGSASVPIIFFRPDNSLKGMRNEIIQHTDIMPSVLGYLHCREPFLAFGRNIFGPDKPFAFTYRDGFNLFEDEFLLQFDGDKSTALFRYHTDKLLIQDVQHDFPDKKKEMERRIKAIIQQYNNRLLDNRLLP